MNFLNDEKKLTKLEGKPNENKKTDTDFIKASDDICSSDNRCPKELKNTNCSLCDKSKNINTSMIIFLIIIGSILLIIIFTFFYFMFQNKK
jgi:ATP-dependent Zn protease